VTVHDGSVAAGQHGTFKAKSPDAAHPVHRSVVLFGIAGVEDELVDWPELDLKRLGRRILRSSPSK
jgi:hypothetical protein